MGVSRTMKTPTMLYLVSRLVRRQHAADLNGPAGTCWRPSERVFCLLMTAERLAERRVRADREAIPVRSMLPGTSPQGARAPRRCVADTAGGGLM